VRTPPWFISRYGAMAMPSAKSNPRVLLLVLKLARMAPHARSNFFTSPVNWSPCGVPKRCSQRGIIPICRRNRVLTPDADHAEKLRG
jgi:hypothetical protein